jgi:hypothetical protein
MIKSTLSAADLYNLVILKIFFRLDGTEYSSFFPMTMGKHMYT